MAENVYEGMFIFDANRYGRDPESVSGQVAQMVEEAGGKLLVSRLWEERRLAYPIAGHRKGAYWLAYLRIDGKEIKGLERKCQLSDSVLRVLFLKVDPRIAETLVAHASNDSTAQDDASSPSASEGAKAAEPVKADKG